MSEVKIAVVQALCGHLTCIGPDDYSVSSYPNEMEAAICFHLEAGYQPAATYWVTVELPPVPTIPELRALADKGEFPKSIIAEWDA